MRQRIIKGYEYKLYPTGDVWVGESLKYRIYEDSVLDYMMQNRFSKNKIDFLLKNGEEYIKKQSEIEKGLTVKEVKSKLNLNGTDRFDDSCYHLYIFLESVKDSYIFACRRCLHIHIINKRSND